MWEIFLQGPILGVGGDALKMEHYNAKLLKF